MAGINVGCGFRNEMGGDLALQATRYAECRQNELNRRRRVADAVVEPPDFVAFVHRRDCHHGHQHLVVADFCRVTGEQRLDGIGPPHRHDGVDPAARHVNAREAIDDLVHLRDDDAAAKRRRLDQRRRLFSVRPGVEVAVPIGLVGDDQGHLRRKVQHHAGIELEIGVYRADLQTAGRDELRELAALRAGEGEIQAPRDAALEHS